MTNSNISTQNVKESNMDSTNALVAAFEAYLADNPQSYSALSKDIKEIMKEHIKPLCISSRKSADGDDWRSQLKTRFSGRGAKWVFVAIQDLEPTLARLEAEGEDCTTYRSNISRFGKAWIRFKGPKINEGVPSAAFEVRTEGSTIDKPKQLHYISIEDLEYIETMPATPHAIKLEENPEVKGIKVTLKPAKKAKPQPEPSQLDVLAKEINIEIEEEKQLNEPPQSDDPAEWQAFLEAEGLVDYELEDLDESF